MLACPDGGRTPWTGKVRGSKTRPPTSRARRNSKKTLASMQRPKLWLGRSPAVVPRGRTERKTNRSMAGEGSNGRPDSYSTRFFIWSQAFKTVKHLIRATMVVALGYFAFRSIEVLAGKDTSVWASLSFIKSNHGLPWVLVGIMLVWALSERKLRRQKTQSMTRHLSNLEGVIDPARTSSGLLPTGQTNPKDTHDDA